MNVVLLVLLSFQILLSFLRQVSINLTMLRKLLIQQATDPVLFVICNLTDRTVVVSEQLLEQNLLPQPCLALPFQALHQADWSSEASVYRE